MDTVLLKIYSKIITHLSYVRRYGCQFLVRSRVFSITFFMSIIILQNWPIKIHNGSDARCPSKLEMNADPTGTVHRHTA